MRRLHGAVDLGQLLAIVDPGEHVVARAPRWRCGAPAPRANATTSVRYSSPCALFGASAARASRSSATSRGVDARVDLADRALLVGRRSRCSRIGDHGPALAQDAAVAGGVAADARCERQRRAGRPSGAQTARRSPAVTSGTSPLMMSARAGRRRHGREPRAGRVARARADVPARRSPPGSPAGNAPPRYSSPSRDRARRRRPPRRSRRRGPPAPR